MQADNIRVGKHGSMHKYLATARMKARDLFKNSDWKYNTVNGPSIPIFRCNITGYFIVGAVLQDTHWVDCIE